MRTLVLSAVVIAACAMAACRDHSPSDPSSNGTLAAMAGTWRTTALTTGTCTDITYTVTPTSVTTANITFAATCAGVAISGSGAGTMNGTTFNWTMNGTAGPCAFSLTGTSAPVSASEVTVTYNGTVCSLPVHGSDTLHR